MPTIAVISLMLVGSYVGGSSPRRGGAGGQPTLEKPRGWWNEPRPWWEPKPTISVRSEMEERRRREVEDRRFQRAYSDAIESMLPDAALVDEAVARHGEEIKQREGSLPTVVRTLPSRLLDEELQKLQKDMDDKKLANRIKMAKLRARRKHASQKR